MPTAIGFGVKSASRPPNGATVRCDGSELETTIRKPFSAARGRYAARQPM